MTKEIWNTVDEKFSTTENVEAPATTKADMFDDLLSKKIPSLTKDELTDLRQAIVAEFNKG